MKYILLSLLFLSSCKTKETVHTPKWQWVIYGDHGGLAIDTSLCSADLRVGDTIFVITKDGGHIVFKYLYQKPDTTNEYNFEDTKVYTGSSTLIDGMTSLEEAIAIKGGTWTPHTVHGNIGTVISFGDTIKTEAPKINPPIVSMLDSILKLAEYNRLYGENREAELQANIDYTTSGGGKKYERLFYKHQDLRVKYAKLAGKLQNWIEENRVTPSPRPIPDTTVKPTYQYFLRHDNPQRYYLALDSVNIISGLIGKAMLYEDALYWLNARARNLNILYYESRVDSVLVAIKK